MGKSKLKTILFAICVSVIFVTGCNNKNEKIYENISVNSSILDKVQDKYYICLPKEKEDGSTALGMICYFNDEKIELSFLPNDNFNEKVFKQISSEIEENFIKYNIEENFITYKKEDGSESQKPEGYFKIIRDENDNLTLESTWLSSRKLNLIDKEECSKIISDNLSSLKIENFIEEFNQKFKLDIKKLEETSNDDNINNNLDTEIVEFTKEKALEYLINQKGAPFADESTKCSKKYLFYDANLKYDGERIYYRILEQEVFPARVNETAWNVYSDGSIIYDTVTMEELEFIMYNDSIN